MRPARVLAGCPRAVGGRRRRVAQAAPPAACRSVRQAPACAWRRPPCCPPARLRCPAAAAAAAGPVGRGSRPTARAATRAPRAPRGAAAARSSRARRRAQAWADPPPPRLCHYLPHPRCRHSPCRYRRRRCRHRWLLWAARRQCLQRRAACRVGLRYRRAACRPRHSLRAATALGARPAQRSAVPSAPRRRLRSPCAPLPNRARARSRSRAEARRASAAAATSRSPAAGRPTCLPALWTAAAAVAAAAPAAPALPAMQPDRRASRRPQWAARRRR